MAWNRIFIICGEPQKLPGNKRKWREEKRRRRVVEDLQQQNTMLYRKVRFEAPHNS